MAAMTPEQFVREALWDRYEDVDRADVDFAEVVRAGVDVNTFIGGALIELTRLMQDAFAAGRALLEDEAS